MRVMLPAVLLLALVATATGQTPPGQNAPEISVDQWFNDPPGTSLADLRGRVVFLEFWATW